MLRDASQLGRPPVAEIVEGFNREVVEPSRWDVSLELGVPLGGIELGEPCSKDGKLPGRRLSDCCLDVLDASHVSKLPRPVVSRKPRHIYIGVLDIAPGVRWVTFHGMRVPIP